MTFNHHYPYLLTQHFQVQTHMFVFSMTSRRYVRLASQLKYHQDRSVCGEPAGIHLHDDNDVNWTLYVFVPFEGIDVGMFIWPVYPICPAYLSSLSHKS